MSNEIKLNYGNKILNLRKRFKLSQENFGKLLDLTKGQISSYEREVSQPPLENIFKIADLFNCAIDELMDIPTKNNFYLNWLLDQEDHQINYNENSFTRIEFDASVGLIKLYPNEFIKYKNVKGFNEAFITETIFLLLTGEYDNRIINHFTRNFDSLEKLNDEEILIGNNLPINGNLLMNGYPLLFQLHMNLNKKSWLGDKKSWPTSNFNILALQLPNGKIIRLYISSFATGCQLYAGYSEELEKRIKLWLSLDKEKRIDLSIAYVLRQSKKND